MTAHTPGPWAIHNNGKPLFGYWHIRQDPKDWDGQGYQAICTLPATKKGTHYGEMFHANARLIAAAPDMLDVLIDVWFHLSDTTEPTLRKIADSARAAIAKVQEAPPQSTPLQQGEKP